MTDLPQGWVWAELGDIAEIVQGQSPPGNSYNTTAQGLPFFQGKAEFGATFPETRKWTTEPVKLAQEGDILISIRAPVGPTNIAPSQCAIGRGLAAIRASGKLDSRYLLWAIRATVELLEDRSTGSTFQAVGGATLRRHLIPLAPYGEQLRIVAALEENLSRIDTGDRILRTTHARLARLELDIIDNTFKSSAESMLPLEELIQAGRQIAYGVLVPGEDIEGGVPLIRVGDLQTDVVQPDNLKRIDQSIAARFSRTTLRGEELLISLVGTIGRVALASPRLAGANTARAVGVFPLDQAKVDPRWALAMVRSRYSQRYLIDSANEVARRTLNLADARKCTIPIPSRREQAKLLAKMEISISHTRTLQLQLHKTLTCSKVLRKSLLTEALAGRLVS